MARVASIILALSIIVVLLGGVISVIMIEIMQFSDKLPDLAESLKSTSHEGLHSIEGFTGISVDRQTESLENGLQALFKSGGEFMSSLAKATKDTLIFFSLLPIFIFFMLYYKEMYRTFLKKTFQKSQKSDINIAVKSLQGVAQNYLVGVFTVIGIMAVLNSIGLLIIGLDYAIFFAVFASFLAVIPYVGSIIGALPAILYASVSGDSFLLPLLVIIVFVTVQLFEGNFITPKIIGSKVSINPFVAIIALLVGAEIWGIAGMILFIPMIGLLRVSFSNVEKLEPYGYLLGNVIDYEESCRKEE